jgi:hypothetical protein
MIRAGLINEITWTSGEWIFFDVGFSNNSRSCGLLKGDANPIELRFNEAIGKISSYIVNTEAPINLVIEAPLSVSFDKKGNPKGRTIEKDNGKTRYWYIGPGCAVMVATLYALQTLEKICSDREIRLFEGFVSFKDIQERTNHSKDVLLLRDVVKAPYLFQNRIIGKVIWSSKNGHPVKLLWLI